MPELAEVEFFRKQWDAGLGQRIRAVDLQAQTRVFREGDAHALARHLVGRRLLGSEARGKQMLFRFSRGFWLGIHLGLTGKLWVAPPDFQPGKHDLLVLYQARRALVFRDLRRFGRVRWHSGSRPPAWWTRLPPPPTSDSFTLQTLGAFLQRHARLALKAALLLQEGFPGIGNWMADEILWRARLHPARRAGDLDEPARRALWKQTRFVCRAALRHVGEDYSALPRNWLFHQRWGGDGRCPRHGTPLRRARIGGRTTAWCPQCQP